MDYKKMGDNIRKKRREIDMTQEQLAELCNISAVFVSQIESGIKKPRFETIYNISVALKVPVSILVGDMPAHHEYVNYQSKLLEKNLNITNDEYKKIAPLLEYKNTKELADAFKVMGYILEKL